jgi:cytochrome P450
MPALEERNYFTDYEVLKDPYAFFEALRAHGPVYRQPGTDVVFVTGFSEALEVLKNGQDFSSIIALQGAGAPLPFEPVGSDIDEQIEANRDKFMGSALLVNYDDRRHTMSRALLGRLFTPSRLKANEQYFSQLSEDLVKQAVARGGCELIRDIAVPFVTLVIADLLGVPAEDRQHFMDTIASGPPPGSLDGEDQHRTPLDFMQSYFVDYVEDRRRAPKADVMSELANSTFPDGAQPAAAEIASLATFLFGAGQDTSAKLLGNSMRYIVDEPGLQDRLRQDPSLIPQFLEEVLRLEGSTKQTARLARKDTQIGDVKIPAGAKVLVALSAANRDPRRWEDPQTLVFDRPRIKEHVAFGRGKHVCAGAPLARVEVRVILEKFLEHTSNIDLDETVHGPRGARNLDYEPSFIIRGLANLKLKLTPAAGFVPPAKKAEPAKAAAPLAAPASSARYSTADTKLSALLSEPALKALLDKHFPGVSADKRIGMAKAMTMRAIQKFAPDQFSAEALDALDADLAQLDAD